jgi:F-type H+-transporting ATPase subunit gamma
VAETLVEAFLSEEIDSIEVLSTHFVSMISYKANMTPMIPLRGLDDKADAVETHAHALRPELLLEPDPVHTLEKLVPMYLSNLLYVLMLEASASELAARMTAMSNATSNAGDLISRLTIQYNKARQTAITQELLEVVGGAEAIK